MLWVGDFSYFALGFDTPSNRARCELFLFLHRDRVFCTSFNLKTTFFTSKNSRVLARLGMHYLLFAFTLFYSVSAMPLTVPARCDITSYTCSTSCLPRNTSISDVMGDFCLMEFEPHSFYRLSHEVNEWNFTVYNTSGTPLDL